MEFYRIVVANQFAWTYEYHLDEFVQRHFIKKTTTTKTQWILIGNLPQISCKWRIEKSNISLYVISTRPLNDVAQWNYVLLFRCFHSKIVFSKELNFYFCFESTSFMGIVTNMGKRNKMCMHNDVVDVLLTNPFEILLRAKVLLYSTEIYKCKRQWKGNSIHRSKKA